ncbi:MAG: MogA/MoaB family molybdenum cofactor biosynthesis protein, partial [Chloroflexia bacterium]
MNQSDSEIKVAVLTVSDGVTAGTREDLSGALAVQMLGDGLHPVEISSKVVPDDNLLIQTALIRWVDEGYKLIVTSGGTGISPRDNTPQATLAVIDYVVPGVAELMRMESFKHTPMAALSRAVVGVRGRTLIVNLPGSPKGVRECLEVIMPILPHAFEQLASGAG